jgi:hypothetical protein
MRNSAGRLGLHGLSAMSFSASVNVSSGRAATASFGSMQKAKSATLAASGHRNHRFARRYLVIAY